MIGLAVDGVVPKRLLVTLAKSYPREMRRALARYGGVIRRRMAKETKDAGGVPMSEIRDALHPGKPGGALGNARTIKIAKPSRFAIVVDWIGPLRGYVSRWQSGGDVGMARAEVRHGMHRRLGKLGRRDLFVDPAATQPGRPVSATIREQVRREAPRAVLGTLKSILAKKG